MYLPGSFCFLMIVTHLQGPRFSAAKNEEFRGRIWGIPRHSPAGPKSIQIPT